MSTQIRLTGRKAAGRFVLLDESDWHLVAGRRWCITAQGYAVTGPPIVLMHRLIAGASIGQFVDHVDGNRLNNARSNLRLCSCSQNGQNQKRNSANTSGFKGVSWVKQTNKFRAYIVLNKKQKWLGHYPTAVQAALAYDRAARELFGEFARVNLPSPAEQGALP